MPYGDGMASLHRPVHPVRIVTASSLFDGHDAAITIMRRILQTQGAEVIHLGHDRSVEQVVRAALHEDAAAVAVSSYQGGHLEYFTYLVHRLAERGLRHVRVFGGGGGVIVTEEIDALAQQGVRIFSPEDGQRLGLPRMVNEIIQTCDVDLAARPPDLDALLTGDVRAVARAITCAQEGRLPAAALAGLRAAATARTVPVLGITGTGGSGKSSLTDELLRRFRLDQEDKLRIAVLAVDPTRRRGGALLGDRIRMNAVDGVATATAPAGGGLDPAKAHDSATPSADADPVLFRSLATRRPGHELPEHLDDMVAICAAAGFDLVMVETPGIGQGDAGIARLADVSVYVMTPEYGAAGQLEKIDMLDFADAVAVNKVERRGGLDAVRDVARQLVRNREAFGTPWQEMPVFGTSAARFADDGVTALYLWLRDRLAEHGLPVGSGQLAPVPGRVSTNLTPLLPPARERYLAEVAEAVRGYHAETQRHVMRVRRRAALLAAREALGVGATAPKGVEEPSRPSNDADATSTSTPPAPALAAIDALLADPQHQVAPEVQRLLAQWPALAAGYGGDELVTTVRDREKRAPLRRRTLSGTDVPRVALPRTLDDAGLVSFLRREHLPGHFPFTAGVFPLERDSEPATRMFAGEGDPARTNRRFHLLADGQPAVRLSTAFDSVTLYGRDPSTQPDVYGKVGTSGVSVATVDDMRDLFAGFDLCDPATSVSMTINGPAPTILAMFFCVVVDQQLERFTAQHGRAPTEQEADDIAARALSVVRGTVQADILKEDQGQNTCIFSTEFALRCMADVQEWFVQHQVRNFYSVSISGYHIAEAGANPITQLAFTLANAFTYVEAYLARGMAVDDFAPNLSFFFSFGMDAEYAVLGRVARRIWAIAMRERYGAGERAQKLKYHVQTSGRSLHAQEMTFNDIRTTLQALGARMDRCNSLHTNAFDEAVTTPSDASVRQALAIQRIIDLEWGLTANENPWQGSFVIDALTDAVEAAVLDELDRLSARGGVLGAMESGYQRGKIQDESMEYEARKHDGRLPIVGVNTFLPADRAGTPTQPPALMRATPAEQQSQLRRLADFHARHRDAAPAALARLQQVAVDGGNVFDELLRAVRVCSLGQITDAFFEVGGQFRRTL
jgi:methylmalonyl-CoA mutase